MDIDLISKFTRIIVLLIIIICCLIAFIVIDNNKTHQEESIAFCGTVDTTNKLLENKSNYRYSANFINHDFNPEDGRDIFKGHCSMCHSVDEDVKVVGPDLFDLFNRLPDSPKNWFYLYLKNSDSLVNAGDKYAQHLRNEYSNIKWNHTDSLLSDKSIIDVMGFVGMIK